ncbi:MAG: glycine zipper 2TM domain-containing protein [Pseudohongiella sp.]|nr:glycine zipper 2TM domain-containing protein [Pseudohongiella sp.]MDO9520327.1 glycine zipper 2TM domain-containing protein [Pseudohongiella sp.]MDP2126397.1 glycine zipper 2TM domain-containing protein [Pseudohongiella sp.]
MRLIARYMIGLIAVTTLGACAPQDTASAENESAASMPAFSQAAPAPAPPPPVCQTCGVIRSITEIRQQGDSTGAGAVIGAIVGGVAGNQVGGGSGQQIATAAGVIGGALLGNNIEQNRNSTAYYEVVIDMDNGSREVVNLQNPSGISSGSSVYVQGGNISLR